jgi:hypothetical protein
LCLRSELIVLRETCFVIANARKIKIAVKGICKNLLYLFMQDFCLDLLISSTLEFFILICLTVTSLKGRINWF